MGRRGGQQQGAQGAGEGETGGEGFHVHGSVCKGGVAGTDASMTRTREGNGSGRHESCQKKDVPGWQTPLAGVMPCAQAG